MSSEIVYSPANEALAALFQIVGTLVAPLKVVSAMNSTELVLRISSANSLVGVQFPDSYAVRLHKKTLMN